ncbi:MAG TPA: hypothetical protein VG942_12965 [Hyphomonadaceae bacterium]|nr:hypothetical protein [Hyphomonadaceae bacterium]
MYMFEERDMPPEPTDPHDDLEQMLAADEAAIGDEGFSARVMEGVGRTRNWRRTAIYGSALAGLGFAFGGIVQMAPHLPKLAPAMDTAMGAMRTASVTTAWHGASNEAQLAVVAVIAGISFLLAAVASQAR